MRGALLAACVAAALSGCELLTGDFRLSGSVDVAPALRERLPKASVMLFIVAKNAGGVPVAVRRIVDPEFPAPFTMGPEDLLVPAVRRRETLTLGAEINTRGSVGKPNPGDIIGEAAEKAFPGDGKVVILLDRIQK